MAKKSKIAKAKKQMAMIEKYADKRQELKAQEIAPLSLNCQEIQIRIV
ncbi:30S ribosomal protein S14 1 [Enterococcus faecalis EnGen0081]|nr:30S ribosomal protein S14 1 [Enterococcus faecalis EnGen0081]